jgi:hypothetical protein
MLWLLDRRGGRHELSHFPDEAAAQALLRHGIPPPSVVVYRDDEQVVPDNAPLRSETVHLARLIGVRDVFGLDRFGTDSASGLLKRRLSVAPTGALTVERHNLGPEDLAAHVEQTVHDTVTRFGLLPAGSSAVLGLSGGVDSGSLLMLLGRARERDAEQAAVLYAATFQDFDSRYSDTFEAAARLADEAGVKHRVIEPEVAESTFHLDRPLAQILMSLMETDDAHLTMYADHHTTRRILEVFADECGAGTIALGLHATDLLAGMINSWTSGHDVGSVPDRVVGPYRYIMPLAFVPKRELHLYYTWRTGRLPVQTTPNQWEFNPTDRNYLYYLADHLQWMWPGIQHHVFGAHAADTSRHPVFRTCENCHGVARELGSGPEWSGVCDVCRLFERHGWLR